MKKKVLFLAAVTVCLIAVFSTATLAWFNHRDSITDKFYVATSEDESPTDIFSVDVWEMVEGEKKQEGQEHPNLLPGAVIAKAPVVENTGRYTQWVRIKITFSDAAAWQSALGDKPLTSMLTWENADHWEADSQATVTDVANDTITYVYYLTEKLEADQTAATFTGVKIPGAELTQELAFKIGDFSITVVAEAVQYDNIGADSAQAAFAILEQGNN